jgi:hypothetical protein
MSKIYVTCIFGMRALLKYDFFCEMVKVLGYDLQLSLSIFPRMGLLNL